MRLVDVEVSREYGSLLCVFCVGIGVGGVEVIYRREFYRVSLRKYRVCRFGSVFGVKVIRKGKFQ